MMRALLPLISLAATVWVIYQVWEKNKRLTTTHKILWTIEAILFNILTAVVYFLLEKSRARSDF